MPHVNVHARSYIHVSLCMCRSKLAENSLRPGVVLLTRIGVQSSRSSRR